MQNIKLIVLLFFLNSLVYSQNETVYDKNKQNTNSNEIVNSFEDLDSIPIYPGCEKFNNNVRGLCFKKKLNRFVGKNIKKVAKKVDLKGYKHIIYAVFTIDKSGDIIVNKSRASNATLEKEVIRILGMLPKIKPGMKNGETRSVKYAFGLPILIGRY